MSKIKKTETCNKCGGKFTVAEMSSKFICKACRSAQETARIKHKYHSDPAWKAAWNAKRAKYIKAQYEQDDQYRVSRWAHERTRYIIEQYAKHKKIADTEFCRNYIGCDAKTLIKHLEDSAPIGFSWKLWGRGTGCYCIDHIISMSNYDLTDDDDLKAACNFANMRIITFQENCRQNTKY